jgi:esterase/lipase
MIKCLRKKELALECYILGNNKRKLFLFCGYKSNLNRWNKNFINELSKKFQVICVNYPNISKSYSNNINYLHDYVKFTIDMFNIKYNEEFYLFGHSMGGYVIKDFLGQKDCPMPKAVIFSNTSAGGSLRVKASSDVQNILFHSDSESEEYIHLNFGRVIKIDELNKSFISKEKVLVSKEQANFQENLIHKYFNNDTLCTQQIEIPACIIHGKNDLVFPIQNAYNILDLCKNYSSLHLNMGSHNHFYDYHKYISNIIISYINNLKFITHT